MNNEQEAKKSTFESIVSEVKRWAGIVEKTATNILETAPKKEEEEDVTK